MSIQFTKERIWNIVKSQQTLHLSIISLLWIVSFIIIKPIGNFPLADDWAYSKTVEIFVKTHHLKILDWYAMTFVTQMLWGALFCSIFGFSFFVLRLSTIVIGIIGVVYFYILLKKLANSQVALLSTLVIAFNPLYFCLSYSFMTDVPFLSLTIISLYYYIEAIKTERLSFFIIATIVSLLATMLKQMGIILPFAVIVAFLFREKISYKWTFYSVFSFIICILSLFVIQKIYAATGNLSSRFGGFDVVLETLKSSNIFTLIISREAQIVMVSGFLLFPLFFIMMPKSYLRICEIFVVFILLLPVIYYYNDAFPGNYINNFHIGPLTFKDSFGSFLIEKQLIKDRPFELIKISGLLTGFVILIHIVISTIESFTKKQSGFEKQIKILALSFIVAYFCFYISSPIVFDRYSFPFLIFIPILVFPSNNFHFTKWNKIACIGAIVIMFCFSLISTHDYFAINKGRWDGVSYLFNEKKASIKEIDGGFEVNGWYNYDFNSKTNCSKPGKTWWWVDDDKYIIALSHLPGYNVDTIFQFKNWIRNSANKVYILERNTDAETTKPQTIIDFETLLKDSSGFVASNQVIQIPTKSAISNIARTGKYALRLTKQTADSISFHISDIHIDDYCEIRFWANTSKLNARIRIKTFSIYWDGGLEKLETKNGWTLYKCGIYAASGLADLANNFDIKIIPKDKRDLLIDDLQLLKIDKIK